MTYKAEYKTVAVGFAVVVIEAEAGWGTKPDGYMVGLSKEALDARKVSFEERNSREYGLYYERSGSGYEEVNLSEEAVVKLEASETGTVWFNNRSEFVKGA